MTARESIIKVDTKEMEATLAKWGKDSQRAVELAAQRAKVQTGYKVLVAHKVEMARVFNNPTRWTLNAFRVQVNKKEGTVEVRPKDGFWYRADNFLNTQIEGGSDRKTKAFERALVARGVLPAGWYAIPGERAKLDGNGNMSVGEIKQIMSWFGAAERSLGSTQNMTDATRARRRKGTKKKAGFEYFVIQPGGRRQFVRGNGKVQSNKAQPGVYRRTATGFGSRIEPVMIFVKRVSYKPRFDFYGVARKTIEANFSKLFVQAFEKYQAKT